MLYANFSSRGFRLLKWSVLGGVSLAIPPANATSHSHCNPYIDSLYRYDYLLDFFSTQRSPGREALFVQISVVYASSRIVRKLSCCCFATMWVRHIG